MQTAAAIAAMIDFYEGKQHDVDHFLKVYAYASAIGRLEKLDAQTQKTLEIGAIVHDIACPLCREKYGHAAGNLQELEGPALVRSFLEKLDFEEKLIDRVCWLTGHHHTYTDVQAMDHQILLEADYLVNAGEQQLAKENIENVLCTVFKTRSGSDLLRSLYLLQA